MSRRIQVAVIAGVLLGALLLLLAALLYVPRLFFPPLSPGELRAVSGAETRIQLQQAQAGLQSGLRGQLLQAFGGLFVVAGIVAAWQQVRVAREGHLTDRFSRAIEHLGSDTVDIRVGGLHALERIAINSYADRPAVAAILAAYVRGHAPWPVGAPKGPVHPGEIDDDLPWLSSRAPDVQIAMHILARLPHHADVGDRYLSRVDLRRIQLKGKLDHTNLRHATLNRAWLRGISLRGADLTNADLRQAKLERADLAEARLERAHLQGARLRGAVLRGADLRRADLSNADLSDADLSGARLEGAKLDDIIASAGTRLPVNEAGQG
ncbi:hypothetical protein GCM10022419_106030 [Nonomuraea rosea]|uniref:Pentapeptide repeat-containing protein n=1 Tax=Nonomuraea rosea TaxID=638574 RepID=A0ABP6ZCA3_9ACTN